MRPLQLQLSRNVDSIAAKTRRLTSDWRRTNPRRSPSPAPAARFDIPPSALRARAARAVWRRRRYSRRESSSADSPLSRGSVMRQVAVPYLSPTFTSRPEAELAAQMLSAEGVAAQVDAADAGGAIPSMQSVRGVRLRVSVEDLNRAEEILRESGFGNDKAVPKLTDRERIQSWIGGIAFALFVVLLVAYLATNIGGSPPPETPPQHEIPY